MLTADEITRVRTSFDRVFANSNDMMTAFYDRVFELAPEVRPMFPADLSALKRDFISKLAVLVGSLDPKTGLLGGADILGRNHLRYGAKAEHYPVVGEALLWSLARGLGSDWTDEMEEAWRKLYDVVAQRMIEVGDAPPSPFAGPFQRM